jgi:cytochrome c
MKKWIVWFAAAGAFALAGGSALAQDAQKLMKEKACLACHAVDNKLVGPAYKEVAAKYRSRKDAEDYLAKKIREGSTGVWGQVPMPPNATVSEAEAKVLAKYVLSLK